MRRVVIMSGMLAALAVPALGAEAGDALKDALYSGEFAAGVAKLDPLAAADDPEAWFGLGAIRLTETIEGLVQALYRHGFAVPDGGALLGGPQMALPAAPDPQKLDYDGVRTILGDFVTGMDEAKASFLTAAQFGDYVIEINPLAIRIDANGDGTVAAEESLGTVLAALNDPTLNELIASQTGDGPKLDHFGFDRADAFWFAGYTQILAAQADLLLAHDFSSFVNAVFHRLFPKAGFPMQDYAAGGMLMLDPQSDTAIADAIAAIHTLDWPVSEPSRLAGVRQRLLEVLDLSRQNWAAIGEEIDDNYEWLPSPRQTTILPGASIDDARVAAWLVTLDKAEDVLEGRLLLPHWRFRQGFDLKAYFERATETDLVMLLTGMGAVPFLADGPIASPDDFRAIQEAFGNDWLGYAFWFN